MRDSYSEQKKVILVANRCYALTSSRLLLIEHFLSSGWKVIVASRDDEHANQLANAGATIEPVAFNRGGLAPLADLRAFFRLIQMYREHCPCLIHHFHVKPVIMGNFAARFVPKAKVVNNIEGLGYAFVEGGFTRSLAELGYRLFLSRSDMTIFLNPDDLVLFYQKRWVTEDKANLIISTGVNIDRFAPLKSQKRLENPRVLMASRLLWQKGIREFVEAARIVKAQQTNVQFQLAGEMEDVHPDAVSSMWLNRVVNQGTIEFLGYVTDMPGQLRRSSIFVLPSYYREGVPRVLLEAAACGIPVITTDVPGCRETVVDGETGFLVPPQDAVALSEALSKLLSDPSMRKRMGRQGRELVEEKFDKRVITEKYLDVYRDIGLDL